MHPTGQAHLKTAPANTHPKFLNKLVLPYPQKREKSLPKKKQNFLPPLFRHSFLLTLQRTHSEKEKRNALVPNITYVTWPFIVNFII